MALLHFQLNIFLIWIMFMSCCCQDNFWSNLIGRVPEGVPGVDYPDYSSVPKRTGFTCRNRKPGFYADPETRCQAWHWCDTYLVKHSFICGNMTLFNQKIRGCDWWYNVDCTQAVSQYSNNDELYQVDTSSEQEQVFDSRRDNRNQWQTSAATPVSNDLGAEQTVDDFTLTNAVSQQPEVTFSQQPEVTFSQQPDADFNRQPSTFNPQPQVEFRQEPDFVQEPQTTFKRQPEVAFSQKPEITFSQKPEIKFSQKPQFNLKPDVFINREESQVFSASSPAPSTELPFFDTSATTPRIVVTSSPATRGILSAKPVAKAPFRQIFVRPNTGGFQINIANAIPIVFPPPPPKALPTTTAATTRGVSQDFDATFAADVTLAGGLEIQKSPATVVAPSVGLTKPRRRLRIRTHPTTATTRAFSTALPEAPSTAHLSITTTTRAPPAALPAFPFGSQTFVPPPGSSQVQLKDFFAPPPIVAAAPAIPEFSPQTAPPSAFPLFRTTAVPSTPQQQKISRFPQFPPFPGTTPQRQTSSRQPLVTSTARPSSNSATLRPFFGTSSTERIDRPTVAFNFGIPFGARILPGESLEQAATERRSDSFLPTVTTGAAATPTETTSPAPRKRKFVEVGKTFPPFSVSTVLTPKYTKIANPSSGFAEDLSTATTVEDFATKEANERTTPKPTKRRRKLSTGGIQWPATTIPITTFRPPVTDLETAATDNDIVGKEIAQQEVTNSSSTDSVSLQDDISLV